MNRFPSLLLLGLGALPLFGASPVVFYTDLASGPATGGENNLGVYVTITGKRFGATQGTSSLTLGGGAVTVKSWSDSQIVFQPGPSGVTGTISVNVGGTPSACVNLGNCDFTVRPGNIYCISNNGNDGVNGKFTSQAGGTGCWRGFDASLKKLYPGDTLYFGASATDTFQQEPNDLLCHTISRGNWIVTTYNCGRAGMADSPIAIVGYPGNSVTVGGTDGTKYGLNALNFMVNYWTVANMNLVGSTYVVNNGAVLATTGKGYRVANVDIQLPLAPKSYETALNPTNTKATEGEGIVNRFYGLYIHNVNVGGTPGDTSGEASKHASLVYQGADGNEQEFAWSIFDGTPQPGLGGVNRCYHNHSSPGTVQGYPIFGVHFHDNIVRGCPGNTFDATVDPGRGSGVEFYNNVVYNTGTGQNWVGYTYGYSLFGLQLGTEGDYNWRPDSGTLKFYNNTIYNLNSTAAAPGGMSGGLFYGPGGMAWGSTVSSPPPAVTICSSACTGTTYSGTLPPTKYTPYYFPRGVAFQSGTSSVNSKTQSVVDDGNGNLTEEGQIIGAINYATGDYNFTLLRTPVLNGTVKYFSIRCYRVDVKNNIFYLKTGEPVFYTYGAGLQQFQMDHNLFYNEGGAGPGLQPTWPIKVTNPVGNNSDPMFVSADTGDFHLKSGSPAIASGADTGIAWDFDGNPRTANDIGAFASGFSSALPCDINRDGKVDNSDVTAAINQTIGVATCGSAAKLGTSGCNVAAVQRVINAVPGGACRAQ